MNRKMKNMIVQKVRNITMTKHPPCCLVGSIKMALFDKNLSSKGIKKRMIPVCYSDKKLELQLTPVSVYLQAYMMSNEHPASVFLTAEDVKYLCSSVRMLTTPSKVCLLLLDTQILRLAPMAEENSRKGIRTNFVAKTVDLLQREYAVLV